MPLTVENSANRWCPLRMAQDNPARLFEYLYGDLSYQKLPLGEAKGKPPAHLACIADECIEWQPLADGCGRCSIRDRMKARQPAPQAPTAHISKAPAPAAVVP